MENLQTINQRLLDIYGRFETDDANWRVVWTKDQLEKRHGTFNKVSDSGLLLGQETGWKEVPKYGYLQPQWLLEKLVPVPPNSDIGTKISYEPIWAFGFDHFGNPLPPKWEAIEVVISTVFAQMNRQHNIAHYEMPFLEQQSEEAIAARVGIMEEMLFEPSRMGDRLAIGEGVSMSGPKFTGEE